MAGFLTMYNLIAEFVMYIFTLCIVRSCFVQFVNLLCIYLRYDYLSAGDLTGGFFLIVWVIVDDLKLIIASNNLGAKSCSPTGRPTLCAVITSGAQPIPLACTGMHCVRTPKAHGSENHLEAPCCSD